MSEPVVTYLTARQLEARYGGITRKTLRNWVLRGELPPPIQIGKKRFWRADILEANEAARQK